MEVAFSLEEHRPVQVGLVVLQADETLERDMRRMLPQDVEYLVSRVPSGTLVSRDTLRAMEQEIAASASLFPRGATLPAVAYGCTSASAEIGPDRVAALVRSGVETPHVTEPLSALVAACRHLGVTRLAVVSPYVQAVSDRLHDALETEGLAITGFASFEEAEEARVVRISEASLVEAAAHLASDAPCDAVFLSCTNLRTLGAIPKIEAQIGKPVLSSNQVLAWHLGQLAGFGDAINGVGQLFDQSSNH